MSHASRGSENDPFSTRATITAGILRAPTSAVIPPIIQSFNPHLRPRQQQMPAPPVTDQQRGSAQVRGRTLSTNEASVLSTPGASPFKRQKLDSDPPSTPPSKGKASVKPPSMYSFASPGDSRVIDLTSESSPVCSPLRSTPGKSNGIGRTGNLNTISKPRKFVVKNLRTTTPMDPQAYFDKIWIQLEAALETVLVRNGRPTSLEELYKSVEHLCRQGKASELFQKLHYKCRQHVQGAVLPQIKTVSNGSNGVATLQAVVDAWSLWQSQMARIKSVFLYLNQSFLISSKTEPTIDELSVRLFRVHVFDDNALTILILSGTCTLVSTSRSKSSEFREQLFQSAVDMLHKLLMYTKKFEPYFLSQSQEYFSTWAPETTKELALPNYVAAAWDLMSREQARCEHFNLDASTLRNINEQMHTFLVDNQVQYLTEANSVGKLMDADDFVSLKKLYDLLQLKGHGPKLRPAFETYVEFEGEKIIFDEKREQEMVPRMLAFKRKNDKIWTECFERRIDIGIGLREGFRKFINKTKKTNMTWGTDNEKAGEMIAKYVDMLLRGGIKAIQDDADEDEDMDGDEKMNQQLDQVLELFRFLNGKAVFEAFYKKDLAKRLLLKQSANDRAEKSMLERLKNECGANFTSNLEQMFKDIDLSRDENAAFKMRREDRGEKGGPDLEVSVLESSAWPSYPDVPIEIPPSIQDATRKFEEHYQSHHTGRKLTWKHDRAYCQLTARYDKNYVVVVSAFQAVVLLYFNDKSVDEQVTYSELRAATKLSDANLVRTMQSLACARFKVLKKSSKGPEVKNADTFAVNKDFKTEKVRFRINQIQLKETKEENKATHERVAADREFETQAAIVRIMKSEQKIKHSALLIKVIEALKKRGAVQPDDIKKQIDKLIDKDYMERIEGENAYEYVA